MGLLDKLWDDTLAGPAPDAGLGKLRRHPTFSSTVRSALRQDLAVKENRASDGVDAAANVSRSITILRPKSSGRYGSDSGSPSSVPSSPASVPDSPLTPRTPGGGEWRRTGRNSAEAAGASDSLAAAEPRSPTVYDWVVISVLDR